MGRISLIEGDISAQEVDVIVNAANCELVLGTGVAGAIRERGGPSIQRECDEHGPIAVGEAALTGAGDLAARFVAHAAAMAPGGLASEQSVRDSLRSSLELAAQKGCESIACPALGTGVAGFSLQRCAEISLEEARKHLDAGSPIEEIRFVLFGEPAFRIFEMVNDSAKVAAQMARLEKSRTQR